MCVVAQRTRTPQQVLPTYWPTLLWPQVQLRYDEFIVSNAVGVAFEAAGARSRTQVKNNRVRD